ncbi:MAG: PorV/PorQ family protein [Elusimicrobiota bacterium]
MKGKYVSVLLFLSALPASAAGTGSEALSFLKIDTGARAAALGGAYAALGDDASSVFYNPAGTAFVDRKEFIFSHDQWLDGLQHESVVYVQPVNTVYTAFAGTNLLLSGEMDRLDASGDKLEDFQTVEGELSLGFAADLGRDWLAGAAFKGLSQAGFGRKASTVAGDAGVLAGFGRLRLGASVSNLGGAIKFGSYTFQLPVIMRAGASQALNDHLWLAADYVKAGSAGGALCAGAEAALNMKADELFFVRAGYRTGRTGAAGGSFTAGVGLREKDMRLDYAYVPYGVLGVTHRLSLSINFGVVRDQLPKIKHYPRGYAVPREREPVSIKKKPSETKKAPSIAPFTW